ncbi:MAG: AMP-binding protein [bacterium]
MNWNLGSLFRAITSITDPSLPAIIDAELDQSLSWGQLSKQSDSVAAYLQSRGVAPGDKVAFFARNRIEYMVVSIALFKIGAVHVNVNFRYQQEELLYVLDNADAAVVFYAAEFADHLAAVRSGLPGLKLCIQFEDGASPVPENVSYSETLALNTPPEDSLAETDEFFMYTGGTTGMPKGVIWTHRNLIQLLQLTRGLPPEQASLPALKNLLAADMRPVTLVNPPWMHSTGLYMALACLYGGGTLVFNGGASFDPEKVWDTVEKHQVNRMVVTGDAVAKPLVDALENNTGRWMLNTLVHIQSAAAVFSFHLKKKLIEQLPQLTIVDGLGASESSAVGSLMLNSDNIDDYDPSAGFSMKISETVKVFKDDMSEVNPGSGEIGLVATAGPIAEGYYKDPEKTAKTFREIDGVRYAILGDYVEVLADGTVKFLGRGNVCINTGGEKVYPEEVESVIKQHPTVADCGIVGVPDERWGSAVTAVVRLEEGCDLDVAAIQAFVRPRLSGYKVPKHVLASDFKRGLNGKLDYKALKAYAEKFLGLDG